MQKYDFLQYNISPLSLSWSDFAIEMSVRGAALKRNDSNFYHLFNLNTTSWYLTLDYSKVYWMTVNLNSSPSQIFTSIPYNTLNNNLQNNIFYKVLVNYNTSWKVDLKIIWENWYNIIWSNTSYINILSPNTYLFIWSNYNYMKQWNDIIDYVKIYRK